MENIKVSIITVSFNSEKTISDTIKSVLNQTYGDIEYIIVDGASDDRTIEIAEQYRTKFADKGYEFKIISEPDKGIYDAMNKGILNSTGDLIGIINSDDWYEPEAVETAANVYNIEHYDLFYADLRIIGENKNFIKKSKNSKWITSRYWNHPTTFIPKYVYDKYKYRNDTIHDDWDLILRIRKDNCKVIVKNVTLANFRMTGVSHTKSIALSMNRAKIKYDIYRKNGYSRLYWIECFGMEIAKYLYKK